MRHINCPKYVLTAIAILTLIAVMSIGGILGVFAVSQGITFITCTLVSILGIYAYQKVSVLFLHIRFADD